MPDCTTADSASPSAAPTAVSPGVGNILEDLRTASSDERLGLAESLAEMAPHYREELVGVLKDPDWHVRWGAVHALGKARMEEAAPAIRPLINDAHPRVARTAAWALGRLRDSGAVSRLVEAVGDENARLSAAAAWALGRIGTPEALECLVEALDRVPARTLRTVSVALGEFGPEALSALVQVLQTGTIEQRTRTAAIFTRFGPAASAALLPLLTSEEVKHRRAAAHILGTLNLTFGEPGYHEAGQGLIALLTDPDNRARHSAARSIGQLQFLPASDALKEMLSGDAADARSAALALGGLNDPGAGPAILAEMPRFSEEEAAPLHRALVKLGLAERAPRISSVPVTKNELPTRADYMAYVTPGLEMVAWEEINEKLAGSSLQSFGEGAIHFRWSGSPQAGAILRSVRQLAQGGANPAEIPLARRLRRYRVRTLPASLEPTTAYLVARLANLGERDVFVDLTCGSATIALERALDGPARAILAGDMDPAALEAARENITAGSQPVHLFQWDARRLPLADRSVHAVAANLPFGRRSGAHSDNVALYPAVVAEADRVLRPGGMAVFVTTEKRLLGECLEKHPAMQVLSELTIETGGLYPTVFVMQKG